MANRWAFLLAVGNPRYAGVGGPSHADGDAAALSAALVSAGYPLIRQTILVGADATKAVIESRVRSFTKRVKKGDAVLVFVAARRFDDRGKAYVACWDTLPDDPVATGIDLAELLDDVCPVKAESGVALLDLVDGTPFTESDSDSEVAIISRACGLSSCGWGESSYTTGSPPRGLWTSLVIEALSDSHSEAVTTKSLDNFLTREFPRRLRAAFGPGAVQTPCRFGSDADVAINEPKRKKDADRGTFDASRFSRVVFRGTAKGRFKDLAGYRKSFATPDRVTPSANKFVARLATADIGDDLRETFDRVVREYGYKRKDVTVDTDRDGVGTLRTPDFEYLVRVALDPADPGNVIWHREVGQFTNPATVRSPAFDACFGRVVDCLAFEFETPWDVAAFVDRFEEKAPAGTTVRAAPDGSSCEIRFAGMAGSITVAKSGLVVSGRPGAPGDLLASLFQFFGSTATAPSDKPALPAKRRTGA